MRQLFGAFGAAEKRFLAIACPDVAPGGLRVFPTTGTFPVDIFAAASAVQPTKGDQMLIPLHFLSGLKAEIVSGVTV